MESKQNHCRKLQQVEQRNGYPERLKFKYLDDQTCPARVGAGH